MDEFGNGSDGGFGNHSGISADEGVEGGFEGGDSGLGDALCLHFGLYDVDVLHMT